MPSLRLHSVPDSIGGMALPRQLSRQAIEEFKAIYLDEFGQRISDDEAQTIALRLLSLFEILVRPARSEPHDQKSAG